MQKNGFTVIELMLAFFILLLLFAMLIPSYKFLFLKSKSNSIHSKLMYAIYLARNIAISTHNEVMVCQSHDLKTAKTIGRKVILFFLMKRYFMLFKIFQMKEFCIGAPFRRIKYFYNLTPMECLRMKMAHFGIVSRGK